MHHDHRRRRTLLGVLVAVSLLLLTLDFRQGEDGPLSTAQGLATSTFAPLQEGLSAAVRPVGALIGGIGELGGLRAEHQALREEHDALRRRARVLDDLERENAALRAALAMRDRHELSTVAGRVIAQPPGAFAWSVLVDVGSEDGVARDMAVLTADGFLGRVTEVSGTYARVELATSPDAGYAVRVAGSGAQGLISGRGARPLEMLLLDEPETTVPVGSEIVTRAFEGSSIPDGLPLGVVEPGDPVGERSQHHDVALHADLNRLEVVLVVLDAPRPPPPGALEDDPPGPR